MDRETIINELIATITEELDLSSLTKYICKDGTVICTDVGYVYDWFKEYKKVLKKSVEENSSIDAVKRCESESDHHWIMSLSSNPEFRCSKCGMVRYENEILCEVK